MAPFRALAESDGFELSIVDTVASPKITEADLVVFQRAHTDVVVEFMEALTSLDPTSAFAALAERTAAQYPEAQRPALKQGMAATAKALVARGGRPIVALESDDNLKSIPPRSAFFKIFGNGRPNTQRFQRAARAADFLVLSTEELREVYELDNPRSVVCPNAIEDKTFEAYCARFPSSFCESPKRIGQVRIGYVGSTSHVGDVATIVKPLQKVMDERPRVRVVFYGQDLRGLFKREYWARMDFDGATVAKTIENQRPSLFSDSLMPRYYEALANLDLDIALAPLERHIFNRSKSNVKVLEYTMAGVPVVATKYGPYAQYAQECPDGIVAVPPEDDRVWVRSLLDLVDHPQKRKALVDTSRAFIRGNYLMSAVLPRWRAGVLGYAHAMREKVAA